jgi:hypothetical protein
MGFGPDMEDPRNHPAYLYRMDFEELMVVTMKLF